MRLLLAETFAKRIFDPDDAPDLRTIREWVRIGRLPGREIGRRTYVDEEAFLATTGNAIADAIFDSLENDAGRQAKGTLRDFSH